VKSRGSAASGARSATVSNRTDDFYVRVREAYLRRAREARRASA